MVTDPSILEKHRLFATSPTFGRYQAPAAATCVDDLLGLGPTPQPATPPPTAQQSWPAPLTSSRGVCKYPMVGGGFDCTREGTRIILPPIRWPLLPPPLEPPPVPRVAPSPKDASFAFEQEAIINPLASLMDAWPSASAAVPEPAAAPGPPQPSLKPAWHHPGGYSIPRFERAHGERLRRTREFPVLVTDDPRRKVWHYCSIMAQRGVFAGHFEVHALGCADIGNTGMQHRLVVYSRDARPGVYTLAMDTHPDGPQEQKRIFLLHDGQANHYRFLATRDTLHPPEILQLQQAQAIESGGAGDCLFYSVARGLGFGGHHSEAALRLRRMATSYLFHNPDSSLNGDTVALFVSKL